VPVEGIVGNHLMMGALPSQVAFEQGEAIDQEWLAAKCRMAGQKRIERGSGPPSPPGEGDVRVEGAAFRSDADTDAGALDLGCESGKGLAGSDAGPKSAAPLMVEAADPGDLKREGGEAQLSKRSGEVLGERALHLANEAQGQVQLLGILPANGGETLHPVEQQVEHWFRWPDGDEQPMHRATLTLANVIRDRFSLNNKRTFTIYVGCEALCPREGVKMQNQFDPRTRTDVNPAISVGVPRAARDAGLRSYMLSVYNYMASGVLLTGIVALLFANSEFGVQIMTSPLRWVIVLSPLAIVFAMSFGINRMKTSTIQGLFWAFAVLMGMSMSTIFAVYTGTSIAQTFFAVTGAFLGLSLFGYTTKKDLSGFGTFLIMGVVGLLVAMVLNIFLQSSALGFAISAIGVLLFAGLTAYDTQKIKSMYAYVAGTDMMGKTVVMGALTLYLDFINMFQFLLSFMGSRD